MSDEELICRNRELLPTRISESARINIHPMLYRKSSERRYTDSVLGVNSSTSITRVSRVQLEWFLQVDVGSRWVNWEDDSLLSICWRYVSLACAMRSYAVFRLKRSGICVQYWLRSAQPNVRGTSQARAGYLESKASTQTR